MKTHTFPFVSLLWPLAMGTLLLSCDGTSPPTEEETQTETEEKDAGRVEADGGIAVGATARCELIRASIVNAGFADDVDVRCDDAFAFLTSDTYPDHDLMTGIVGTNEQIPVPALDHEAPIPLSPKLVEGYTTIDAAVGVAVNGVPIYDYSSQGELDPTQYVPGSDTFLTGQLDVCGGHAGRGDDYHYHVAPTCMMDAIPNLSDATILGWGLDGFPLYGQNKPDGSAIAAGSLERCNGMPDDTFGYRYHTSDEPPYIIQCLEGEVDLQMLRNVPPLSGANGGRPSGTPPQGGVQNLVHTVDAVGTRTMTYEYRGEEFYILYAPSERADCYNFETKTVTSGGIVETGEYCR